MHSQSDLKLENHPGSGLPSRALSKQAGHFFIQFVSTTFQLKSENDFVHASLDLLLERLGDCCLLLAIPDPVNPANYRIESRSRLESQTESALQSLLSNLIPTGIDSISKQLFQSLPVSASYSVSLVRSASDEQLRIMIVFLGKDSGFADLILDLVEPLIRVRLQAFRSESKAARSRMFLGGLHRGSSEIVKLVFKTQQLLATLLEISRELLQIDGAAILFPTDDKRSSFINRAQSGFSDAPIPVSDPMMIKAFDDFDLNGPRPIVYLRDSKTYLLVPLVQRNLLNGVLLLYSAQPGYHLSEESGLVAEIIGYWVSLANENATIFQRFASSQTEWENTFDSIADPIYIIDGEYRLKKINKSLATYAMKSIKLPLDPNCYRYLFNQSSVCPWCPVPESLKKGAPVTVETPLFTGGQWQVQSFPYTDKSEERIGSINVLRDITVLKRMQEQLIETEKLASAGKLISGVAHEVRNPLFGISATVRALANELKDKQDIQPFLDIITSETSRLNRLMEDLLNYTRPVKIDRNASDLVDLVNEVIEYFQHLPEGRNARFNVISADWIPAMNIDSNKIKQVLFNLFENGIQHSKEEPRVDVFLQYLSLSEPPEIHLVVKDNGSGINEENLTRVFDPFFTTRQKGTGLGLSIVRKVIHDHGGRISVESHPGIGTTFRITLPLTPHTS